MAYDNPKPVAVLVLPVRTNRGDGVLLVRRNIQPGLGKHGLPAGYMEGVESAEEAAARELLEETDIAVDPMFIHVTHTHNTGHGQLLIFCVYEGPRLPVLDLDAFVPNSETQALDVAGLDYNSKDIVFDSHVLAIGRYLSQ